MVRLHNYVAYDSLGIWGNARDSIMESGRRVEISLLKRHKLIDAAERKAKAEFLLSMTESWSRRILDSAHEFINDNPYRKFTEKDAAWVESRVDMFCRNAGVLSKGILYSDSEPGIESAFHRFDAAMANDYSDAVRNDRSRPYQHELAFTAKKLRRE